MIKYCSFNIEDFVAIDKLYKNKHFDKFKENDIILIQEWKEKEGNEFIVKLNNQEKRHYICKSKDRLAIIFDENKFKFKKAYGIELLYEPPHILEKLYTKGRRKKNIMVLMEYNNFKLCVINFHLHAYDKNYHPGFHKKQLSKLLSDSLDKIMLKTESCGIIMGGDTNYRGTSELLGELIDNPITPYGELKDVCVSCKKIKTQTFSCIHEKGIMKRLAKRYTRKFKLIKDSRLDFIATNLVTDPRKTKIIKLCSVSDHSAVFAKSQMKLNNFVSIDI